MLATGVAVSPSAGSRPASACKETDFPNSSIDCKDRQRANDSSTEVDDSFSGYFGSEREASGSEKQLIYVIGERLATILHVLNKYGLSPSRTAPLERMGRRSIHSDAAAMLQAVKRERPCLV